VHLVANIHIDLHHESGDLGMNINNLIRLELSGKAQGMRNFSGGSHGHLRCRCLSRMRFRVLVQDKVRNDAGQNRRRDSRGDDQGGSLSHSSNAPQYEVVIARFTTTRHVLQKENMQCSIRRLIYRMFQNL